MPEERRTSATSVSAEATPATLRDYYQGRVPPKRLFAKAGAEPADAEDPTQREALLVELDAVDSDLRKTAKLISGRASFPRWLQTWLRAVVERETGGALDPEEASAGLGLRRLFTRCREGLAAKDAAARRRAYNLLRLSLIWVHSLRQIEPVDLAEEATRLVAPEGRSGFRGRDLERGAVVPFLRATNPGALRKVVLSLRLWIDRAQTARADVLIAKEEIDRLRGKVGDLQQDLATARENIQVLQGQLAQAERQVASLSGALESERNRRINEMREIKGRLQRLFDSELAPRLRGAREALDGAPLALDVALERLDRVLELLEEERAWLSSD